MANADLAELYRRYIDCLNMQDWTQLGRFVHDRVVHNDKEIGLSGYHEMLLRDFAEIPDLRFTIGLLVAEAPYVASRLDFTCSPRGRFLGLPIDGRTVSFSENVFYEWRDTTIIRVWSVIDKAAIEAQLPSR